MICKVLPFTIVCQNCLAIISIYVEANAYWNIKSEENVENDEHGANKVYC